MSTYKIVRDVFQGEIPDLKFDRTLAEKLHAYKQNFINRNKEHAAFFGGNLLGVHAARFLDSDRDDWFDHILDADEEILREQLHALPGINPEWHISSSPMNLSCIWVLHEIFRSGMPSEMKKQAMLDTLFILQSKFITSILGHFFRYPADKAVAEATYAALNLKFILKEQGSWLGLINYRCEEIISPRSPHYNTISRMDNDKQVVDMLNAIQGALKGFIKNMRQVMERVRLTGGKLATTSSVAGVNGEEILKDRTRGPATYTNYLKSVLADKRSFVHEDLMSVITKVMPSVHYKHLKASLEYISTNYFKAQHKDIENFVNLAMSHSYAYLANNRMSLRANVDLADMLVRLRGAYTSSRSTDVELLEMRETVERVIRPAVASKTEAVVSATRTGVLLYIVARAYAMNHYSNSVVDAAVTA